LDKYTQIDAMIAEVDEAINSSLRLVLSRWYKRVEFRKINNSVYKDEGFGISAEPNFENPQRMVISLNVGGRILSYKSSATEIDDLLHRHVIPEVITEEDVQVIAQASDL
jgi:hypothetical protein